MTERGCICSQQCVRFQMAEQFLNCCGLGGLMRVIYNCVTQSSLLRGGGREGGKCMRGRKGGRKGRK